MLSKNSNLKTCTWCKKTKELSEFYYSEKSSGKDHYYPHCIECDNEKNKEDRRSKDGVVFEIYRKQKKQAKSSSTVLQYTKDEFYEWLISQELFLKLYEVWIKNDYNKDLKPACYKIDFDLPFTLNNIALATSKDVIEKYFEDIRTGTNQTINNKTSKPVLQYTKDGKFIRKHHSSHAAERYLQEQNNDKKRYSIGIINCKNGKAKSAHGYKWIEDNTPTEKTKFGTKIEVKHLENYLIEDIENILDNEISIDTEKEELIKCRIGQGKFRDSLIEYWKGCSVTNFQNAEFLIASHIKPWRSSSSEERLDLYNGLLLIPNLDKLFDKGYISFDNNGKILISKSLNNYQILGVNQDMNINIKEEHEKYLTFHREQIFKDI